MLLYYKNPTTGAVTTNEVSDIDVDYWKQQGWTTSDPRQTAAPAPAPTLTTKPAPAPTLTSPAPAPTQPIPDLVPQPPGPATTPQYQILNVKAMGQYQPNEYERLATGEVVLKPGVAPKEGTVKQYVPGAQAPIAQAPQQVDWSSLYGGLGKIGASVSDWERIMNLGTPVTQTDVDKIREMLGITPELINSALAKPSKTTQELYDSAYTAAGLADIKARLSEIDKRIEEKRSQYLEKANDIKGNEWLSEANLRGEIKRLAELAEGEIANDLEARKQLAELYNQGINEINALVQRNVADFAADQAVNKAKLAFLLQEAESRLGILKGEKQAESLRYFEDYLKGVKTAAGKKAPQVIGSASTGYYTWDPNTQTFKQVIGASGTGGGSRTDGSYTAVDVKGMLNNYANKLSNGSMTFSEVPKELQPYLKAGKHKVNLQTGRMETTYTVVSLTESQLKTLANRFNKTDPVAKTTTPAPGTGTAATFQSDLQEGLSLARTYPNLRNEIIRRLGQTYGQTYFDQIIKAFGAL